MRIIHSLFIIFLFTSGGFAQVSIDITVINRATNQPVSDVLVGIRNQAIGFTQSAFSNSQGKVLFEGLSTSGAYDVFITENVEWKGIIAEKLVLTANKTRSVTLLIAPNSMQQLDEISVVAPVSSINRVNAEVSSDLNLREIQSLPIEGRDITRALFRLPNVTQATGFFNEAPNVSINGANSLYTSYQIDGMDNNERFLGGQKFAVPVGFTQNITVLTNNYSVEFGQSGNGIFNITSRSGSNELSGEAYFITRPGPPLDSSSDFSQRDLSGNSVKDGFERYQTGFAIGGPIKKNRTFFYLNAEGTLDLKDNFLNSPQLGVGETVRGENTFLLLSGKLDHTWSPAWRSSIRINSGFINIERQGGGLEGGVKFPSAADSQDRNSLLIASKTTYTSSRFSSETDVQYSRFRWNFSNVQDDTSPRVSILGPDELPLAELGHSGFVFNSIENTVQLRQRFTFVREKHRLKAGMGIISSDHSLLGGGNPNGNYTVRLNNDQLAQLRALNKGSALDIRDIPNDVQVLDFNVELRPQSFGKTQNIYSLFVEDIFSVSSNLNLTFGLRYDYDNLSKGGSSSGDFNNFAPRFNFNYGVTERSSIRGGYGLFYDKIVYAVYSDALQRSSTSQDFRTQLQALIDAGALPEDTNIDRVTFAGNITATFPNVSFLQGPSFDNVQQSRESVFSNELRILNPNGFDNPYTHQFSVGFQHQISEDKLFYVDVMHSRGFNQFRLRDVNAPTPFEVNEQNPAARSQDEADASRVVPVGTDENGFFALVNGQRLRGAGRNITITETRGESRYWAATLNLEKQKGRDNYSYRINYTLSRLRNNTEDINFRAQDANDFEDEWGPAINDRTHVINGFMTYYPVSPLSLTLAGSLQSGQPINRIPDANIFGTTDLNGDGRSFDTAFVGNSDRSPGESRNNDRLPWATTFDLGVQYLHKLKTGGIEFRADIFNLFDAENLSGHSNNATQSNQIQAGPKSSGVFVQRNAAPPRQFQFSIRYLF